MSVNRAKPQQGGASELSAGAALLGDALVNAICRLSPDCRGFQRTGVLNNVLAWGRRYLPTYFRCPPSKMHLWLADEFLRLDATRGARLNVLGPRGGAKSTVGTLGYVLKCAVEGREPYIWIVSATKDQAAAHLEHIKAELEQNPTLIHDFPRGSGRGPTWRVAAIELTNGTVIEAYGAGQQLRGRRRREHRPSLIVCDDLQNDLFVASPDQRAACCHWFQTSLLKAGDGRTNIVNLATALHRDALAMRLHRSPGWTSTLFRSIVRWPDNMELWRQWEERYCERTNPRADAEASEFYAQHRAAMTAGAEVLWPEREDLYALMRMRVEEGRTAFEREKQNSPVDPERCEWPEAYFDQHIWCGQWPEKLLLRIIALDPSKGGDSRHGDYSAYVLLGIDAHGILYVEADMARRPTPAMVARGVELCQRFQPHAFGVEANQFQELLAAEFVAEFERHRRFDLTPQLIHNQVSKALRIRRLGPLLAQRKLRFLAKSEATQLLVDQLRDFPLGDHDDGPDALEMAFRLAEALVNDGPRADGLGDRLIRD